MYNNYSRELLTDIINLTRLPPLCMAHVVHFKHFLYSQLVNTSVVIIVMIVFIIIIIHWCVIV